jgi:hypothetical protein
VEQDMADLPKVYLIGGAPGVGKSTFGRELATRIGATSLSADDLMIAAKGATTAQSHPGLHIMSRVPSPEYFTTSSVEQLKADATIWGRSADPERMRANFLARSLWYNELIQEEAGALGLRILVQDGQVSPNELCARALANEDG